MIARVIYTEVDAGNRDRAVANLNETVIPGLKRQAGFVAAYWTVDEGGNGMTMILWNDAKSEAANEAHVGPQRAENLAKFGVRLTRMETREVMAHSG